MSISINICPYLAIFYFLKKQKYIFKIDKQTNIVNCATVPLTNVVIYEFEIKTGHIKI